MKHILIFFAFFFFWCNSVHSQPNTTCQNAAPFCTGTTYNFPAGVNAGSAQNGPYYDCLFTQPNPVWYYMQVAQSGPINIVMQGSGNFDIDFCCWGPFNSLNNVCNNLTANNVVDCSYSTSATETCVIPNAVAGQYYILLITNFSNQPQNIIFSQSNSNQPGAGSTNCGILCSMTVTGTSSLCAGQTATLNAVGNASITNINWIGPNNYSSNNNPSPSIPNLQATTVFTAIATTTGTNPATNTCALTLTVTVQQNPNLNATNGGPYCAGQNGQLNVNGASSYTWSGPGGFSSNLSNPSLNNLQPSASGVYTVIGASAAGCTNIATTNLQVNNNPTVQVSSSGNYCEGQSFVITASGATSYTWSGPNNFSSNNAQVSFQNNNLNLSGTYTVIGANGTCTNINSIPITINPTPNVQVTTNAPVCQNNSLTLSASGANTYQWSGPNNFSYSGANLVFVSSHPFQSGTYTVIGTSANGCTAMVTTPVTVYPEPLLQIQTQNRCQNETIQLNLIGANGVGTFSWTGPNGFYSNVENPVIPNAQLNQSGVYVITYTSPAGCLGTASAQVEVYPLPDVTISGNPAACYGKNITLTGSGAMYYKWLAPWGTVSQSPQLVVSTSSPTFSSVYTLVGMDNNGCTNTISINTIVYPLPQANISLTKNKECVPFCSTSGFNSAPQNLVQTNWYFSDGTSSNQSSMDFCVKKAGTHTLTLYMKDNNGCENRIDKTVEGYPVPNADFSYGPGSPTFLTPELQFYDQSTGANVVKWLWDFMSDGNYLDSVKNPVFNFKDMGRYMTSLIVTSDHGCKDTIFKTIIIDDEFGLYIPNAFTPNGDGLNDEFMPKGHAIEKWDMYIFDRWGNILFHTKEFGKGWDGKVKGADAPNDVYTYLIKVKTSGGKIKEFKGHVTLLK